MLQSTQTFTTTVAASAPTWWDKAAALSTVAVAAFAVVELGRAYLAHRQRRAAADARAAALAFALWRQLDVWLSHPDAGNYLQWGRIVLPEYPPVEERFLKLVEEVDASKPVRRASREALVRFYEAIGLLHGGAFGYLAGEEAVKSPAKMRAAAEHLARVVDPAIRSLAIPEEAAK